MFPPRELTTFFPFFIQKGFDVFNALDLMENKTFLEKLKFGIGDGNLQYYLYNWKCPSMGSEKVLFYIYNGYVLTSGFLQVGFHRQKLNISSCFLQAVM